MIYEDTPETGIITGSLYIAYQFIAGQGKKMKLLYNPDKDTHVILTLISLVNY